MNSTRRDAKPHWRLGLMCITLVLVGIIPLQSQPPPGTTENPEGAVRLRTIWVKTGTGRDSTIIGIGYGGISDINGDGYSDVAVTRELDWEIYLGGDQMSTVPALVLPTNASHFGSSKTPIVAHFFGADRQKLIGLRDSRCEGSICYYQIRFYRPDPDSLLVPIDLIFDPGLQPASANTMASDLDGDGDDELIFVNREGRDAVVRIYEGGEEFSLEVPTKVIRRTDTTVFSGSVLTFYSSVADYDGDGILDLNLGKFNTLVASQAQEVWFWWGGEGGFRHWGNNPDRVITSKPEEVAPLPNWALIPEDFDGDGVAEILGLVRGGDTAGTYIWLSRGRESARTREFSAETVDITFPNAGRNRGFGFVADSLERYEMMTLLGGDDGYGFGGGLYGPNDTYDAHFGGGDGPGFGGVDAGDVDGNGWRDRLIASETYGGPGVGRAVIVAGGPYIPVDDPTVSVRSEPVAGELAGLKLWPNPVVDRAEIAWRGDLRQMPHRVVLSDASGRTLLDRGLPTWKGSTSLDVAGYPVGAYRLSLFDIDGELIASTSLIVTR